MHTKPLYIVLWVALGLLIAGLITMCILFTVWQVDYDKGIKKASTAVGSCAAGQEMCRFVPDDTLGVPTFDTSFNVSNARVMSDLLGRMEDAALSDTNVHSPPNFNLLTTMKGKDGGSVGLWETIVQNVKILYLIFYHGKQIYDLTKQLRVTQKQWPVSVPASMVHLEMLDNYQYLQADLLKTVKDAAPQAIYVAGHQLGGAMATLASTDIVDITKDTVTYLLGTPSVGNADFANLVKNKVPHVYRISNQSDVVCQFPLPVTPNFGGSYDPSLYKAVGSDISFDHNQGSWDHNNSIANYITNLKASTGLHVSTPL